MIHPPAELARTALNLAGKHMKTQEKEIAEMTVELERDWGPKNAWCVLT